MEGGSDLTDLGSRTMVDSAFVAGTRSRYGIAEIGAELAGGVRVLSTTIRPIDADLNDEDSPSSNVTAVSPLLEARLRAAIWVSPHVFFAGQVGVSALDHDDVNVGLAVGILDAVRAPPLITSRRGRCQARRRLDAQSHPCPSPVTRWPCPYRCMASPPRGAKRSPSDLRSGSPWRLASSRR